MGFIALACLVLFVVVVLGSYIAPSATARSTPSGFLLRDGWQTLITLSNKPSIQFWEVAVTPVGVDGGDATNFTTMHNSTWRTKAPKSLKELTPVEVTAGYDPDVLSDIIAQTNVQQTITVRFPDSSTIAFYGFLQKFELQEHKEGEMPMAKITITPTNWDPTANVEAGPTFTAASGT